MKSKFFIIVLSLLCNFSLYAQLNTKYAQLDTRGTDFWITFGKNFNLSFSAANLQVRIVAGEKATTGTIHFTNLSGPAASVPFSVGAGQAYNYRLNDAEKGAVYNLAMTSVANNLSMRITTDVPVTVYALNQNPATTDATNILPVQVLGTEHYQISYPSLVGYGDQDAYAVVATEDNTQVHHNNTLVATLNTGQVYYRTSLTDMTGAHITANKPVAFFAMNSGVYIPRNTPFADNLFQQLAPVHTWGKNFFVPVTIMEKDIVRIVASRNNTVITQTGGTILDGSLTLNAGQFVELMIPLSSNGCFIHANKPIGVCTYLASAGYITADVKSDPAQAWLPSIEQLVDTVIIAPFVAATLNGHYALVVTPTANKDSTKVKIGSGVETALTGGTWYDKTVPFMMFEPMSFYSMRLNSNSAYQFTNDSGLFVMGYGHGSAGAESYYYLASSAMRDLSDLFYVNNIYYKNLTSEVICAQPVQFRAEIKSNLNPFPGYLKWYVDSVEVIKARDSLRWEKPFETGTYLIEMEVQWDDEETVRTIAATIKVELPVLDLEDVTICAGATSKNISFPGTSIDTLATTWVVTSGSGMEIGMKADAGTGIIPSFTAINTGTTDISVTVTVTPKSPAGCEGEPQTFTITVDAKVPLDVHLGNDTMICRLDSLLLNAYHPNADSYQWQDNSNKMTYTVHNEERKFWVIISAHCNEAKDTIDVRLFKDLKMKLGGDVVFCEEDVIYRILDATTSGATSYLWHDGDTSQTYIAVEQGIYSVTVSNVCMSVSDEIEIKIKDCSFLEIWIPNAFTPDGDGINDLFKPQVKTPELLAEYKMTIYNRWGKLIFTTQDYLMGWDGKTHKNEKCNAGVYTAIFEYKDIEGKRFVRQTSVTLFR